MWKLELTKFQDLTKLLIGRAGGGGSIGKGGGGGGGRGGEEGGGEQENEYQQFRHQQSLSHWRPRNKTGMIELHYGRFYARYWA